MKLYSIAAVDDYLSRVDAGMDIIPGCLCDTYIVYHPGAVEILKEEYVNQWSSAYSRHVYRKKIPVAFFDFIRANIAEETDAERREYLEFVLENLEYAL